MVIMRNGGRGVNIIMLKLNKVIDEDLPYGQFELICMGG